MNQYRTLDPAKIVETIELLARRIGDRFPDSGLSRVCQQLAMIGRQAQERSAWISRPIIWLRLTIWFLIIVILMALGGTVYSFIPQNDVASAIKVSSFFEIVQGLEAGLNEIVMLGLGIFFLFNLENRTKRRRALAALHELRSLTHIIDMHQLTKDPERLLTRWVGTANSPEQTMTQFELQRYLDYCSELLSLTGKIAALYVQNFHDEIALASVNEVESLSASLSRKIWQKIMILHSFDLAKSMENESPADSDGKANPGTVPNASPASDCTGGREAALNDAGR